MVCDDDKFFTISSVVTGEQMARAIIHYSSKICETEIGPVIGKTTGYKPTGCVLP